MQQYALIPTVVSGVSVLPPAGMMIDSQGRITWNPTVADIGQYPITVQVTNNVGLTTTQAYTLSVVADTQAPTVVLRTTAQQVTMGQSFMVLVQSADNVGVTSLEVTATFATSTGTTTVPVVLDTDDIGTSAFAILLYNTAGLLTLTAAAGNVGTATTGVTVIDPSVVDSPTTNITSPGNSQDVTAPIPVIGTVSDPQNALLSWSLSIAEDPTGDLPSDDPATSPIAPPKTIATGTTPITNGTLGTLDPTVLANGSYVLTLTALNAGGLTSTSSVSVTVSKNLKLGALNLSFPNATNSARLSSRPRSDIQVRLTGSCTPAKKRAARPCPKAPFGSPKRRAA